MAFTMELSELATACVNMRIRGYGYDEIAKQTGAELHLVYELVKKTLDDRQALKETRVEELRSIMTMRNEVMLQSIAEEVESGNLYAIDRALKIQDQIATLNGVKQDKLDITSGGQRVGFNAEDLARLQKQADKELEQWNDSMMPQPKLGAGSGSS